MMREAIDFRYILLENYKRMKISENELATILMMDHLINDGNSFITADLLSLKMSLDSKTLDTIIANLYTKGFIDIKTVDGKTQTSIQPLKDKLYHEFQISLTKDNSNDADSIFEEFETLLGRPLSPVEFQKIREWIEMGYDDRTIIDACKESVKQGKKNLRNIDKILLNWSIRKDREEEGHSPINDEWDKDLEETIRIAKTPWITEDDED